MSILIRNGKYYCRFQLNGERHHYLCAGATSVKEAKIIENQFLFRLQQQQNGIIPKTKKNVTMRTLYNLFENYSKINKKSYSRDVYFIRVLKRHFPENLSAELKLSDFEAFKTKLLEDGKSIATVNKYLNILKHINVYMVVASMILLNLVSV